MTNPQQWPDACCVTCQKYTDRAFAVHNVPDAVGQPGMNLARSVSPNFLTFEAIYLPMNYIWTVLLINRSQRPEQLSKY